ncbi:hypothetical protein [Streptomyces sp. NPDC048496]|uniref:hypothetical protein n=1 Tax=Streptomyces sp. NPDC048496 TaxID=3365558 RepID=UPI0037136179
MSAPMSASTFLEALMNEGLTVVRVGDWRTHSRNHKGPWEPVNGVMIHHAVDGFPGAPRSASASALTAIRSFPDRSAAA